MQLFLLNTHKDSNLKGVESERRGEHPPHPLKDEDRKHLERSCDRKRSEAEPAGRSKQTEVETNAEGFPTGSNSSVVKKKKEKRREKRRDSSEAPECSEWIQNKEIQTLKLQ